MADDVYVRLREFLDRLPGGFPASDSGVELKLLERYFTPEQAEIAMNLRQFPETAATIAERMGSDAAELADQLETMAREGCILRIRIDGEPYYLALQFLVGFYEFHINAMDRELAELLDEYLPTYMRSWEDIDTKQMRVVPVGASLDTASAIATYDSARELISSQDTIAVAECICRKEKQLLGKGCDHPLESCLTFGVAANYYIENSIGRRISQEECLAILDRAEKSAMVLAPSNSQIVMNICTCCGDSCNFLASLRASGRPADHALSSYQAHIDPEECTDCETCLERCQIEAIVETDGCMEVDRTRCIGCGLCVTTCPVEAITLVEKSGVVEPPANFGEMQMKLSKERGLI
jgi:Na+-translocating ferredoxin:NAD+ oxidoreductase subunit B